MERDTDVAEILAALARLRGLYGDAGAKTVERNLAKVIELLTPHHGKSLEFLAAELRAASAARVAERVPQVDQAAVQRYVQGLNAAGTDPNVFEVTFVALSSDTSVRSKEVSEIARQFTHTHATHKTKKAALAVIKQTFLERVRFENKLRAVS